LYWKIFSDRTRSTLLNGTPFGISTTLAAALESLRREDEAVLLWVNTISVDQEDAVEKADQMEKMARIFTQAEKTCIWLGPAADDSDFAMKFIRSTNMIDIRDYIESSNIPPWPALQDLFARTWWSRIGIFERVIWSKNAKNVTVKCGMEEVKLEAFLILAGKEALLRTFIDSGLYEDIYQRPSKIVDRWTFISPETPYFALDNIWHGIQEIRHVKDASRNLWLHDSIL